MAEIFVEGSVEKPVFSSQFSVVSPQPRVNDTKATFQPLPLKYPMADNSLWSEGAQADRLAELTANTADPAKELPLRRDVRSLGILLGRVLVEQEGEAFFDVVEKLRHLLIQHREQHCSGVTSELNDNLMARAR